MNLDWMSLVSAVAPTVATALGGPLAGAGVAALSSAIFGESGHTEQEVAEAIKTDPQALVKLKEAELTLKKDLAKLNIDLEKIHQQDRASARKREADSGDPWTPRILAGLVTVGIFIIVGVIVWVPLPAEKISVLTAIFTSLMTLAASVYAYYFGSSKGSSDKNRTIERAMDQSAKANPYGVTWGAK